MEPALAAWLERLETRHPKQVELGLERVRKVAARLPPARPARHVISVAGTNGKGSCVAFIESIARAGGWRVGSYTSPHLERYNERVRIEGREATDAELVAAFEAIEAARGDTPLTYFETGTLAALWLFQRAELDLAVLEVGLGGRLDAVNVVDADCAVITTVDLDHRDWLGDDIERIGHEKAGIARAWKPLVLGDDDPPASVLRHAYAIGASSWRIGSDFFAEPLDAAHWRYREPGFELELPRPGLAAPVQMRNAACAIAALRAIGFDAAPQTWARGVAEARIAARMQSWHHHGVEIVLDVGHNPQAARALAAALAERPRTPTLAVYAALADKDAVGVVQALAAQVDGWIIAGSLEAGPRGQEAAVLAERLSAGLPLLACAPSVEAGIELALEHSNEGGRILVFGSFHAAERGLKQLRAKGAVAERTL
ncbi:bifunctional tetrahydrofolate synthase/dihydrofolate synthase [Luteimonas sp. e5]